MRPEIVSVSPREIGYNQELTVTIREALDRPNGKVVLMRPASVTHSFNFDQRLVELRGSIPVNAFSFTVQTPSNHNVAPPGYYLLFVVRNALEGAQPSVKGEWVKLGP